ncbi:hypothetical protein Tco_0933155 [Tanacetum coccineum]
MTTLQFADTHNLVAFLSKPAKSEGFEQIVDFLNANPIRYALTINPTIYTSCIEQFWATVKVKTVNGEIQLQALVDGKKIIVTEASVRRDLQLNDEEGTDCLPNATIFEKLTRMGSTMAYAIICLATNQKFNFSKYIFESMVKNLDNAGKFLMYPRFMQVFLDKQIKGMQIHKRIYDAPYHTKKIFRNMKRLGKGFSGKETPLFLTMVVQNQAEMGEGSSIPTDPHHTPIQPSTSQPQKKQRSRRPKGKDTEIHQSSGPTDNVADEAVNEEMDDSLVRAATNATSLDADSGGGPMRQETIRDTIVQTRSENVSKLARGNTLRSGDDRLKLQELMELCITLQSRVLALETTKTTQANEIDSLKRRVKRLEKKDRKRTHKLKRLYKVGLTARIESSKDEVNDQDDADMFGVNDLVGDEVVIESKVAAKDVNLSVDEVTLAQAIAALKTVSTRPRAKGLVINEQEQAPTPIVSSQQPSQVKVHDKAEEEEEERLAREKAQQVEEANIAWDDSKEENILQLKEQKRKGTDHQQKINKGVSSMKRVNTFIDYRTELVEESSKKVEAETAQESSSKRVGDELEQESIKKQKVDDNQETAGLQRLIEVVPDKEEVAIYAISLATKPLSIIDYNIHKEGKKTYYQIIRADGSSKMYLVFSHMLKSFDREDLETLWKLVKAKHG